MVSFVLFPVISNRLGSLLFLNSLTSRTTVWRNSSRKLSTNFRYGRGRSRVCFSGYMKAWIGIFSAWMQESCGEILRVAFAPCAEDSDRGIMDVRSGGNESARSVWMADGSPTCGQCGAKSWSCQASPFLCSITNTYSIIWIRTVFQVLKYFHLCYDISKPQV